MTYRLTYWNKRGRGEQVRLLLQELGQPYEDVHIDRQKLVELKKQGAKRLYFGSVPMLEDGDFRLCQAPVILSYLARKHGVMPEAPQGAAKADALVLGAEDLRIQYFELFGADSAKKQRTFVEGPLRTRWLPSFEGHLELNDNDRCFVGSSPTHADVAVWDIFDSLITRVSGVTLADHPRLMAFQNAFAERPRIASYLSSERRAQS
jgi:glutathione S-transferase